MSNLKILCDTREPWPHPWAEFMPGVQLERATLETGDFALAGDQTGAVVERKAPGDLLACLGREHERFESELKRGRYAGRFIVVCESSLESLLGLSRARNFSLAAIVGTLAAWQRRYCPIFFAGTMPLAASFTVRFLSQPYHEAAKLVREVARANEVQAATVTTCRLEPAAVAGCPTEGAK